MNAWRRFWRSLNDEGKRDKLAFIGQAIAAVAVASWAIFVYLKPAPDSTPADEPIAKDQLIQAELFLNTGRYADAKQLFEKIDAKNEQAQWGLKITAVRSTATASAFKQAADALYKERPTDAQANLFLGEYYALAGHDRAKPIGYYRTAIQQNPQLAEAYFDLAVVYFEQGDWEAVEKLLNKDEVKSTETPKYRSLLANVYVKQGRYKDALDEYGGISAYPLAALESAKIHWLHKQWPDAVKLQEQALAWLDDQTLMAQTENQEFWNVEIVTAQKPAQRQASRLIKRDEKKIYTVYCLAVSLFLQGDANGADNLLKRADAMNASEIKDIVRADLAELAAKSDLAGPVAAFEQRYLH